MKERIDNLISFLQKIYPNEEIDKNFKIKGTPLEKLCEFNGPGYRRVEEWAKLKTKELESRTDVLEFKEVLINCYKLMMSRNKKYGDSWKELGIKSIIDLVLMKLVRVKNQDLDPESIKAEAEDCINYLVFLLMKIKK